MSDGFKEIEKNILLDLNAAITNLNNVADERDLLIVIAYLEKTLCDMKNYILKELSDGKQK